MRVRVRARRGGGTKREVMGEMGMGEREARDGAGKGESLFGSQMDTDGRRWRHEARDARRNGKWRGDCYRMRRDTGCIGSLIG
jgi:hypothetical protein